MFSSKYIVLVIMFMFEKLVTSFNFIHRAKRYDSKIRMETILDPEYLLMFTSNAVPVAVGLYILAAQDRICKETLAAQDRKYKESLIYKSLPTIENNLKETLATEDKNIKLTFAANEWNLEETLAAQERDLQERLRVQNEMSDLRFKNIIDDFHKRLMED